LGVPLDNDESSIIKRTWINACIDAHIKLGIEPTGSECIGYDIADDGNDNNATVHTKGILCYDCYEWKGNEDELNLSATKVFYQAIEKNANIVYDCVGVGASAGSKFKELNSVSSHNIIYTKFNAGAGVQNPEKEAKQEVIQSFKQDFYKKVKETVEAFNTLKKKSDFIFSDDKDYAELMEVLNDNYYCQALTSNGVDKLQGDLVSSLTVFEKAQTTELIITDEESLINAGYFIMSVDKTAVKNALLDGVDVVGAKLEITHNENSIKINKSN